MYGGWEKRGQEAAISRWREAGQIRKNDTTFRKRKSAKRPEPTKNGREPGNFGRTFTLESPLSMSCPVASPIRQVVS